VGRASDATIRLEEPEVSRHHAVVFRKADGIWVVDLQSANGTAVNGRDVTAEPASVGSGDMLSFGPSTFALKIL
jgi:pSer/pThr/pTyr-binding forkhead associated (FHA) protein